jgi:hypothetical protein
MKYTIFIIIAIVGVLFACDPDPNLDNDWKDFKTKNAKDYKKNKTEEDSRFA